MDKKLVDIIDDLHCVKFKINNYLDSINFQDDVLVDLSITISDYIESLEYQSKSDLDKTCYDLRKIFIKINNKFKEVLI